MLKKIYLSVILFFTLIQLNGQVLKFAKQLTPDDADPDIADVTTMDLVGRSIVEDAEGNIILTGKYSYTTDFDPSAGRVAKTVVDLIDVFVAKYTSDGELIWVRTFGGLSEDEGVAVVTDLQSNIYVLGNFTYTVDFDPGPGQITKTSVGPSDVFLSKFDKDGNLIWVNTFGGNDYLSPMGLGIGNNSELFITGNFPGTIDFDPGNGTENRTALGQTDIFISKYTTDGLYHWTKQIGGSFEDWVQEIAVSKQGNVFITGAFKSTVDFDPDVPVRNLVSNTNEEDIFIAKYTHNGEYEFATSLGGTGQDGAWDISLDCSENIYITGYFFGTVDFDPSTSEKLLTSNGSHDGFLSKYDGAGNFIWTNSFGSNGIDLGNKINTDANGTIYLGGFYNGTVDFNPSSGQFNLTETDQFITHTFFSKYSTDGEFIWAYDYNDDGWMYDFDVTSSGELLFTGFFREQIDVDPSSGVMLFSTPYTSYINAFFGKFLNEGNVVINDEQKEICQGEEIVLVASGTSSSIEWTLGTDPTVISTQPSISVSPSSSVTYHYSDNCIYRNIIISVSPAPQINGNTELCKGEQTQLSTNGIAPIEWTTGSDPSVISNQSSITVSPNNPTTYYLKSGTCPVVSVIINVYNLPLVDLGSNPNPCEGDTVLLEADGAGSRSYLWQNGSISSSQKVYASGKYLVEVTEGDCMNKDSVSITFINCNIIDLNIPNLITPNGDHKNDSFFIVNILPESQLQIFNRWGDLVYMNSNYDNTWNADGHPSGIYYFYLKNELSDKEWNGWVHVLKEN